MQPVPWPEPDPRIVAAVKAMYGSRKTERPLAVEIRDSKTVTCPQGQDHGVLDAVRPARQGRDRGHLLRQRLRPLPGTQPVHHQQQEPAAAHRAAETTAGFQADYARRAGVEGTMHQATSHGARQAR